MDTRDQERLTEKLQRAKQIRHIVDIQITAAEQNVLAGHSVSLGIENGKLCVGNLGFSLHINEADAALAVSLLVIEKLRAYRERLELEYRGL